MSIPGVPDEFEELMPCPACPDGYVWDSNGPTCKPCPVCKGHAAVGYRAAQTEQTSGKAVFGSVPGHTEGQKMPGPLYHQSVWLIERGQPEGQTPTIWWCRPGRGDYKYGRRWTETATKAHAFKSFSAASNPYDAGGLDSIDDAPVNGYGALINCRATEHVFLSHTPAADPIADLCAELRATHCSNENLHDNAAYELERPARTERLLQACVRHETARAERAEAERDALRECVRAADGLRAGCDQVPPMVQQRNVLHAYDAARAKVTLP